MCRVERRGQGDEMTVVVEVCPGAERPGPGATVPLIQIAARQKPIRLIDRRRA